MVTCRYPVSLSGNLYLPVAIKHCVYNRLQIPAVLRKSKSDSNAPLQALPNPRKKSVLNSRDAFLWFAFLRHFTGTAGAAAGATGRALSATRSSSIPAASCRMKSVFFFLPVSAFASPQRS